MDILALAVLVIPTVFGVSLAAAAKVLQEKMSLTALGALVGVALFTTITYAVSTLAGLNVAVVTILLTALLVATLLLSFTTRAWQYWWQQPTDFVGVGTLVALSSIIALITVKLLFEKDGALFVGIGNAWGDLGWHMANIMNFAEGQSVPPQNPIFSGTRLTYPFLSNFLSAILITLGASVPASVVWPALFLIPCGLALLYSLTASTTKRRLAGVFATVLFVFVGGTLGWTRIMPDFNESSSTFLQFLTHLPREYTGSGADADGYHFLNPLLSLFLPQRSFLFGIPLALGIVLLLTAPRRTHFSYLVAGLIAGILPLFHGHTVLALVPAILVLFAIDVLWKHEQQSRSSEQLQNWILFALIAGIIGIPEILYYVRGSGAEGSFFRWDPGWTAGEQNLLWFWFKNTGLLLPLIAAGFFLPKQRIAKTLATAGLVVFVTANLYIFAPWAWDNFKLLIFWLLLCLPLAASFLAYAWQRGVIGKVVVSLIVIIQCFTGALDLMKNALPTAPAWVEWDSDGINMATRIREIIPPGQAVVTAPYHNNPVALAGRPVYLGFSAHVWSHGGSPWQREQALPEFYQGRLTQLPEHQPSYVLVGPVERQQYPQLVIAPTWQLLAQNQQYQLYRVQP